MVEVRLSVCPSVCRSVSVMYTSWKSSGGSWLSGQNCQGDPPILSFTAFLLKSFLTICRYIPLPPYLPCVHLWLFICLFLNFVGPLIIKITVVSCKFSLSIDV
jgi:hypothetical protein